MSGRTCARLVGSIVAALTVTGMLALAASAGAAPVTAYNNLNTVAKTVNGLPNEDTFSLDYEYFATGGQIELSVNTIGGKPKTLTTQLDVFACEHGVYSSENCLTLKPKKKFAMAWTASIYTVGPGNTVGSLLSTATATFKLPYRPSTIISCPATSEGKGFGANCDVGGQKQTITFKKFAPSVALPQRVIILLTNSCGGCSGVPVNVGLQASYKEYAGGEFIEEPAANGGIPAIGADPDPENVYLGGILNEGGWAGFHPVYELTVVH